MVSIRELLTRLHTAQVDFVIVGGMAAVLHGSAVVTEDLDVCAPLTTDNLTRLLGVLKGMNPRHRMTPSRLPLAEEPAGLLGFKNLYLETDAGQLDIFGAIDGVGDFATVAAHAVKVDVFDFSVLVLDLDTLIRAKQALGRPKDQRAVAELEVVRKRMREKPTQ